MLDYVARRTPRDGYAGKSVKFPDASSSPTTQTVRTVPDANGDATVTTTNPDDTKRVVTITGNQKTKEALLDETGAEVSSTVYAYDGLRRVLSMTDSRTGTTTFDQDGDGTAERTDAGSPEYMEDFGGRVTTFSYDAMGRRTTVDRPNVIWGRSRKASKLSAKGVDFLERSRGR